MSKFSKRYLILFFWGFFELSLILVFFAKFFPIIMTPLMVYRSVENLIHKDKQVKGFKKDWVELSDVSPFLVRSIISLEDPKFKDHHGFDWEAIKKAIKRNSHRRSKIGASTITQQTAKNLFLLPIKSYIRKGIEAYFAILLEIFLSKQEILEIYINIIEWGHHIYGAEAAAEYYFGKKASALNSQEALLLAAIIPNPRKLSPIYPSAYVRKRVNLAKKNTSTLGKNYFIPLLN